MRARAHVDIPAAIFCGGEHLRLGRLASAQPKALLVAYDTPLLWRLIDQLRAAGFDHVIAATTPRLERQIGDSLERYATRTADAGGIRVEARAAQVRGVLFGLRDLLAAGSSERYLLCLGDIFFLGNPFLPLAGRGGAPNDVLVAARATVREELTLGGILTVEADRIRRVTESPTAAPPPGALRWSGVALAERAPALEELDRLLAESGDAPPPGELFEAQRARGRDIRLVQGPDFVNVNSPDHLLLSSLYARLEVEHGGTAAGPLREAARVLREEIAVRARGSAS